jgi:spermidine synthase
MAASVKLLGQNHGERTTASNDQVAVDRFFPILLLLFAGSGFAALVYEIVWFQMVQLVIGSSAVSMAVLLGTFMGGMCLGSLLLPRLVSPRRHPLRVWAAIELGIGVSALVLIFGLPHVDHVYATVAGTGFQAVLLRGAVCAVCLLPPTMLMGATLPAIARGIEATPQGISWLGLLYGSNIAGAVCGCLIAGFYLLRVHDLATAIYVAASVNGVVSLVALLLARCTAHADGEKSNADGAVESGFVISPGRWTVYLTIAISGATALAAEVIWTRLLSLMLGPTVYTFSIILAVFLVGLGIGSGLGSILARAIGRPRILFAGCQLLLGAAIVWTANLLGKSMPYWPINPYLAKSPWDMFQIDLMRCAWALLPATSLWGAAFPLALAAAAGRGRDAGRLVGGVYAANTVGAIVGAIGASLFLVHSLGTFPAQRVLVGLCGLAAVVALMPYLWTATKPGRIAAACVILTVAAGTAPVLVWERALPTLPWELVAFGRVLPIKEGDWKKMYVGEGINSSVAVTTLDLRRVFHVNGKSEASTDPNDMRLQRMLGHLPALLHSKPRSVLIVGCGAGVTAGCFVVHPEIERIVICEIEPLVPKEIAPLFRAENHDVVNDPRVEIIYDDARHYILTAKESFDIISSDPIHPWVKGSAVLYTTEYFELCKRRLNPGGFITQWVPLYESDENVVKSEFATFFEVFPEGTVWSSNLNGNGYDVVMLGQVDPLKIDADEIQERLQRPDHTDALQSINEVDFETIVGLLGTYAGHAHDLQAWLQDAEINRDRNLRLQYLAGLQLDANRSIHILNQILAHRRFRESMITGSGFVSESARLNLRQACSLFQAESPIDAPTRDP